MSVANEAPLVPRLNANAQGVAGGSDSHIGIGEMLHDGVVQYIVAHTVRCFVHVYRSGDVESLRSRLLHRQKSGTFAGVAWEIPTRSYVIRFRVPRRGSVDPSPLRDGRVRGLDFRDGELQARQPHGIGWRRAAM